MDLAYTAILQVSLAETALELRLRHVTILPATTARYLVEVSPKQIFSRDEGDVLGGSVLRLDSRNAADQRDLDPRLRSIVRLLARQAAQAYYDDLQKEARSRKT